MTPYIKCSSDPLGLKEHLVESRFVQSNTDSCLLVSCRLEHVIYSIFWVDGTSVAASTDDFLIETKERLANKFNMKALNPLKWFHGIEFKQFKNGIEMSQDTLKTYYQNSTCMISGLTPSPVMKV